MCGFTTRRCSPSFPPPFCIVHPWRNELVSSLSMITGRGSPGTQVTVRIDDLDTDLEMTAMVDCDGWWTVPVDMMLIPGEHTIYAYQTCGSVSEGFTLPFMIEQPLLPTPIIWEPAEGAVVPVGHLRVRGNGSPGNAIAICMDGMRCRTVMVDNDGVFFTDFASPGVEPGVHIVTATEESPSTGQTSQTASNQFTAVIYN